MFSALSSLKPARFSEFSGMRLMPPPRVENPFAKPACSSGAQIKALTPFA
jgi:hypothetical protein